VRFVAGVEEPYRLRRHVRCVNLISSLYGGVVPPAEGWEPVRALPSFASLVLSLPEGTPLSRTVDIATCPGTVYLSGDNAEALEADYARIRELEETVLYG
jgi:hypothetical protein